MVSFESIARSLGGHDHVMNEVIDAHAADLEWSDLPAEQCPDGVLNTGVVQAAEVPFAHVGVWEHPVGTSTDVEQDEVFVVVSGRGRIVLADGTELALYPGVIGTLVAGTPTTWIIEERLRKVWLTAR